MKTIRILICYFILNLAFSSWSLLLAETKGEIVFYVSPGGNDSLSGTTADKAFATLQKARDAIWKIKQNGKLPSHVTDYLLGGTYELSEPFILTVEDSGTEECPITYCAYKREQPIISGGKAIRNRWEQYKGNIMLCNIPEAKDGKWKFRQLFLNGKRIDRARIPNKDQYYRIEKTDQDLGKSAIKFKEGDIKKWNNLDEVVIMLLHSWNESRLFISDIDEQARILTFIGPIGFKLGMYMPPTETNRYYVENVLEGLDQPGEWYLDNHSGKLYLYPSDDLNKSELRAPVINQLILLQGDLKGEKYVQYINFRGITFSDTDYKIPPEGIPTLPDVGDIWLPSAITLDGTKFCTFEDNRVRNTGTYALEIIGDGNKIIGNEIYQTGGGGIITRSYGKERNVISFNHIHDCGDIFFSGTGINIDDGGGDISHNLIYNIAQTGIYARHWRTKTQAQERRNQEQGHVIEYNEIQDVLKKMNDDRGIFVRDSNIIIRNNLIYNVIESAVGTHARGIYLGCETRYSIVENNVVYNASEGLIAWYATRHMTIENNIFADCKDRSINYESQQDRDLKNNHFLRNIVYIDRPNTYVFSIQRENTLPMESDFNVLFQTGGITPAIENRVRGEISSFTAWLERGYEKSSIIADPLFRDPQNHDYTLLPNSPALKLGFKQTDLSNVGLKGIGKK